MNFSINFEVYENGTFTKINHSRAKKMIKSGKYFQSNTIQLGDLEFLVNGESFMITLEPMRDDE